MKVGNHRFVSGEELGICARCGEFSADPIHHPVFPGDMPKQRVQFPTMLRKMWSGAEVQQWLDENVNGD